MSEKQKHAPVKHSGQVVAIRSDERIEFIWRGTNYAMNEATGSLLITVGTLWLGYEAITAQSLNDFLWSIPWLIFTFSGGPLLFIVSGLIYRKLNASREVQRVVVDDRYLISSLRRPLKQTKLATADITSLHIKRLWIGKWDLVAITADDRKHRLLVNINHRDDITFIKQELEFILGLDGDRTGKRA